MRPVCIQNLLIDREFKSTLRMQLSGLFHDSHHPNMLAVRVASWIIPLMLFLVIDTNNVSFFKSFTCFHMLVGETQQRTFGFRQTGCFWEYLRFFAFMIRTVLLGKASLEITVFVWNKWVLCTKMAGSEISSIISLFHHFPPMHKPSKKKKNATQKCHQTIILWDRCRHGAQFSVVPELNDFCLPLHLSVAEHLERWPCKSLTGVGERTCGALVTSGQCADLVE